MFYLVSQVGRILQLHERDDIKINYLSVYILLCMKGNAVVWLMLWYYSVSGYHSSELSNVNMWEKALNVGFDNP
jgi:hypothetical protein